MGSAHSFVPSGAGSFALQVFANPSFPFHYLGTSWLETRQTCSASGSIRSRSIGSGLIDILIFPKRLVETP